MDAKQEESHGKIEQAWRSWEKSLKKVRVVGPLATGVSSVK